MTINEFFKELEKLNLKWRAEHLGVIRCMRGDCPITALARSKNLISDTIHHANTYYNKYGRALNLDYEDIGAIVSAADYNRHDEVRKELEKVTINA